MVKIEKFKTFEFEEVEYVERSLDPSHKGFKGDVPSNREKVVDLMFCKLNRLIERVNYLSDQIGDLERRVKKQESMLFHGRVDDLQERLVNLEKKSVEIDVKMKSAKKEVRDLQPDLENVKDAIYSFMRAVPNPKKQNKV